MSGRVELISSILSSYKTPSYLEIGFGDGSCFNRITVDDKTCVDPHPYYPETWGLRGTYLLKTSDDFFKENTKKYDVIFIDGDHEYAAVRSDFENSVKCLKDGGVIVLHDCNPINEWMCRPKSENDGYQPWNGDGGYRLLMWLYQTSKDYIWNTSPEDQGCCVVKRGTRNPIILGNQVEDSYAIFDLNRDKILNLTPINEMIKSFHTS